LFLPIDPFIDPIVAAVRRSRAAIVTAAPGAGKTTRVPPALVPDGPVILLQPRRIAARAIATRIAAERGWTLGHEVGWQIRFDRRFSAGTRLLVVTEGILTARLQTDPLLSDFKTIVLDEFHERSIHADLAVALAREAWRARRDLGLVVMSATLNAAAVSAFLDLCPIVEVPGEPHPVAIEYEPGRPVADAVADVLSASSGQVLCFLPGAPEIHRTMNDLQQKLSGAGIDVVPLHGSLDADAQDQALAPVSWRRVIVATNIAETSLTVPGVAAVVDTGLHKVARYDTSRGIDSLETERITADAADQRAGRAGRTGPGIVRRLWDPRDRLRPHREAEIHRVDLSAAVLDVIAWGGDPRTLQWFERPRDTAIDAAMALLERLGLIEAAGGNRGVRLTELGDRVRRLPLHPRLARMLVEAGGAREVAQACALLSERHLLPPRTASTSSDLLSAIDDWRNVPAHVQRVANVIADFGLRIADSDGGSQRANGGFRPANPQSPIRNPQCGLSEVDFRRAILAGYPDRVAQRREPGSATVRLATGAGGVVGQESGVRDGEFLVALEVQAPVPRTAGQARSVSGPGRMRPSAPEIADARIRLASRVEREWLKPTASEIVHRFDEASRSVKAARVDRYDALTLSERPVAVDPEASAQLLIDVWLERGPRRDDERLLRRLRFAGHTIDLEALLRSAAAGARTLDDVALERGVPSNIRHVLDHDAPEAIVVPSGRRVRLEYKDDGSVSASVKLQELFGLATTPCVGTRREPVLLSLLAPNGRPVQLTRDLRSFWERTYPEVRKELRGRYPKHPWPEDPWKAQPTHRTR
jgi:ATP-dependent helicase HrpB